MLLMSHMPEMGTYQGNWQPTYHIAAQRERNRKDMSRPHNATRVCFEKYVSVREIPEEGEGNSTAQYRESEHDGLLRNYR